MVPAMDIGSAGIGMVVGVSALVQLAWLAAVIVFVYKIWQKSNICLRSVPNYSRNNSNPTLGSPRGLTVMVHVCAA
jgi:hypothetical protein